MTLKEILFCFNVSYFCSSGPVYILGYNNILLTFCYLSKKKVGKMVSKRRVNILLTKQTTSYFIQLSKAKLC